MQRRTKTTVSRRPSPPRSASSLLVLFQILLSGIITFSSVPVAVAEDVAWARVKKKSIKELKHILDQLHISYDEEDDDEDIRSLAYDEDALEQWLDLHPSEKKRVKESERRHETYMDEFKKTQEQVDYSHVKDPERRLLLEKIKQSGVKFDGAESKPTDQLKMMVDMVQDGTLAKMSLGEDEDKKDDPLKEDL
mmetsp:Transcript_5481/g.8041  ORF Transcript_5481/g.8041 Transcript_5481/m.8041 type:complete len:193 (-) Transcript_5481:197-775(-)